MDKKRKVKINFINKTVDEKISDKASLILEGLNDSLNITPQTENIPVQKKPEDEVFSHINNLL